MNHPLIVSHLKMSTFFWVQWQNISNNTQEMVAISSGIKPVLPFLSFFHKINQFDGLKKA
jgi:hypothetical protein